MTSRELQRLRQLLAKLSLREIRTERGVGLREMGRRLGCTHQNILNIERRKNPRLQVLADYLGALEDW